MDDSGQTRYLLKQWHDGDLKGLDRLLEKHLSFVRKKVAHRLSPMLRGKAETQDYVQDVLVQFLRYAPRFVVSDKKHFRALLIRIVENTLHDGYDHYSAMRRDAARERPLPSDTVLDLDMAAKEGRTPSKSANRHEREALVRFALELLDPDAQRIIVSRDWKKLSFSEIGGQLHLTDAAARMRYTRALGRLEENIWNLRKGKLSDMLDNSILEEEP